MTKFHTLTFLTNLKPGKEESHEVMNNASFSWDDLKNHRCGYFEGYHEQFPNTWKRQRGEVSSSFWYKN